MKPSKPVFYKYYVERKKNESDELYNALDSYHQNIKLILELDPTKFLDTEIILSNGKISTQVYNKMKKLALHWTSKIPVRYKRNAIIGELHRAKKIALTWRLNVLLTSIQQLDSLADLFIPLYIILIVVKTI